MEKFGVADDDLISGLRDEEHQLMLEVMHYMNGGEKTASETASYRRSEARLAQIRAKITEHDLKKSQQSAV